MQNIFISFLLFFSCCISQTKQNNDCYFPVNTFLTEQTYCFVNLNDPAEKSYWKMQTTVSNTDTLLNTAIYDTQNRLTELMTEKIAKGNSNIISYTLYDYDRDGKKFTSDCQVEDSFVFKSTQKSGENIQWKIHYKDAASGNTCELSKVRTLTATAPGQQTFSDRMKFSVMGTTQGYEYSMISIYKKNKGLVSYTLTLPDGKIKNFVIKNN